MRFCVLDLSAHNRVHHMQKSPAFVAGPGLALRGYYTLNKTNDQPITRTVCADLFVPVSINYWVLVLNPSQMLLYIVHPLWCV